MKQIDLIPSINKNDKKASVLILLFSLIVFVAVVALSKIHLDLALPFDVHVFAFINALINSMVAVLLLTGLLAIKQRKFKLHKSLMMLAMLLSILFLLSYIAHHLLAGETKFGGTGTMRSIYYLILFTHIPLAGIILPFILFTAYRSLIGEYDKHKKLAKITWPVWFYVAVTGVLVYVLISPYYH